MPYAPGISYDWSPFMQGAQVAGGAIMRGSESAGRAIGAGMASMGRSLEDAVGSYVKKKEEIGMLDTLAKSSVASGDLSAEDYLAFQDANIGKKRALVSEAGAKRSLRQKEEMAVMEHLMRLDEIAARTRAEGAGFMPSVTDLGSLDPALKGVKLVGTSKGGGQILDSRGGTGVTFQEDPISGARFVVTGKGAVHPITSGAIPKPDAMTKALLEGYKTKIANSEQAIVDAQAELKKGNKKRGPDWNPLAKGFDQVILEEQAKISANKQAMGTLLEGVRGRTSAGAAAGGVPAPAGSPVAQDTPEAIRSQYKAGTISRDDAKRRLQALGYE